MPFTSRLARTQVVAVVAAVLALGACTGRNEGAGPTSPTSVVSPTTVVATASPTTAVTTTRRRRDTTVFDAQLTKLTLPPDMRLDVSKLLAITPYFVIGTLRAASPSDLYSSGNPPLESSFRGVSLTFEVTEVRPLPSSATYPGKVEVGRPIVVDFFMGAYKSESDRAAVDALIQSTVDVAPIGALLAMFVGPSVKAERWNTIGPQASAYVLDDGSFSPLQPIDYDGNLSWWRTVDLRSLRRLIDETAAR